MIRVKCPACSGIIFLSQFNQTLGRTVCHFCSNPVCLTEASLADPCWQIDLKSMSIPGTWLINDGRTHTIGASTRSVGIILALPAMLLTALLAGALLWVHVTGRGDWGYSVLAGAAMVGSLAMLPVTAMMAFGRVTVQIRDGRGRAFSGVGRIGWVRRFDWSKVRSLSEQPSLCRTPQNAGGLSLTLEGDGLPTVRFGAMLNDVRRYFMFTALCKMIGQRNAGMRV